MILLVILDIDETLLYATKSPLDREEEFKVGDYFVYLRPYYHDFIQFIFENFDFAIWSSASDDYVEEIVQKLGLKEKAKFCWARSKATLIRPSSFDMDGDLRVGASDHLHYVKRLRKVKTLGYKMEKMVIIDDTPHKAKDNYGNAIYIKEFTGDQKDEELKWLPKYLKKLKDCENVRTIEKRNWREEISK